MRTPLPILAFQGLKVAEDRPRGLSTLPCPAQRRALCSIAAELVMGIQACNAPILCAACPSTRKEVPDTRTPPSAHRLTPTPQAVPRARQT